MVLATLSRIFSAGTRRTEAAARASKLMMIEPTKTKALPMVAAPRPPIFFPSIWRSITGAKWAPVTPSRR